MESRVRRLGPQSGKQSKGMEPYSRPSANYINFIKLPVVNSAPGLETDVNKAILLPHQSLPPELAEQNLATSFSSNIDGSESRRKLGEAWTLSVEKSEGRAMDPISQSSQPIGTQPNPGSKSIAFFKSFVEHRRRD